MILSRHASPEETTEITENTKGFDRTAAGEAAQLPHSGPDRHAAEVPTHLLLGVLCGLCGFFHRLREFVHAQPAVPLAT